MKINLFLQLSPEFGGTKFGPFDGVEVRLGSDPSRNDIVLPEALGVAPEHVKVIKQKNDDSYLVAPVERTAGVFIWRADGRAPKQTATPIAVGAGDSFSLVTPEGPRFIIVCEYDKPKAPQGGPKDSFSKAKQGLSAGAFWTEIKRQGLAKVMTTQVGYWFRTAKTFIVSGAIFSPRNLIMLGGVATGWLVAGGAGCAMLSFKFSADNTKDKLAGVERELASCTANETSEPTVPVLTQQILKDLMWADTLEDEKLRQSYIEELKEVFSREAEYNWVYNKSRSPFVDFQKAVANSDLPDNLKLVVPYVAAIPNYIPERDYVLLRQNSEGVETCGRGPALLTYRQAKNLGMSAVYLDALMEPHIKDIESRKQALLKTAGADIVEFKDDEIEELPVGAQGSMMCVHIKGTDDRTDPRAIVKALERTVGKNADGLPKERSPHWISSRLMMMYAADYPTRDFTEVKFGKKAASVALSDFRDSQKNYAIESTAAVLARAVAIPCMARLDKKIDKDKPPKHIGTLPSLTQCGVLSLLISRGEI